MLIMLLFTLFQPNFAFAQSGQAGNLDHSPISRGLCNVFELVGGNIGKAIAIFAIVMVGFGFFSGKFSIALVIGITLGIGILFGAPKIIAALTGEQVVDCNTVTPGTDVACLSDIEITSSGISLIRANYNSTTKSFIIYNNGSPLASVACYNFAAGEVRVQFTPLVSSTSARTATVANVLSLSSGIGTVNSGTLPKVGNFSLTTTPMTSVAGVINFTANAFCPYVSETLTNTVAGAACAAGSIPVASFTAAAGSGGASDYLCASGTNFQSGTTTVSNSNVTHAGTLVSAANSKIVVTGGFLGDQRRVPITGAGTGSAPRYLTATCTNGNKWTIDITAAGDCTTVACYAAPSASSVNLKFVDQ